MIVSAALHAAAAALLVGRLTLAAIDIDGMQAVEPSDENGDDASPIGDIDTYYPDQHDCPLTCVDYANTHSWITYLSADRLKRCQKPMLLQFSATQPLGDPLPNILIRACTLGSTDEKLSVASKIKEVENPKKEKALVKTGSLNFAPACNVDGTTVSAKVQLSTSNTGDQDANTAAGLLKGLQKYFGAKDNCNEKFSFAYHKDVVASVYIGAGLGKPTADSVLEALAKHLHDKGSVTNRTVAQLCGNGRDKDRTFGVVIDTSGNLAAVQKFALDWSKGKCADGGFLGSASPLPGATVFDIAGDKGNQTTLHNSTSKADQSSGPKSAHAKLLGKRTTCQHVQIVSGDSCGSLASRCGISGPAFDHYNSQPNFCSTLMPGKYACCSSGDPYTPPKPDSPKPGPDGTCATHLIHLGDTCSELANKNGVTVDDIEKWNKGKTWAWIGCKDMLAGYNMCLSAGTPPMPPPQEGTQCGPLVPGTKKPTDDSVSLADLNPCPLKACCSNWGFCGPFEAHCAIHAPKDGGPGAKLKEFQNTCVSNCGMDIKQNSGPPDKFQRVGYYETFGLDRDCLRMYAKDANTDGSYTHIHWAFASIDPKTWKPVIDDPHNQWKDFKALTGVKRIVSFGGWAYSTEPATYNIIRQAIIDNRNTFAENLANFAKDEGIDGIDIDWEYPGAPDIYVDGKPIGQKKDGIYYLMFLSTLKNWLGSEKSVSIAAPASFWYLQAFPIDRIAKVIDYIVYMTYDLHGQWDYGNVNAFDNCPSGKCIRSHVNLTETRNSLSVITKAGVANNKIFVGEASYGRSFHMKEPGCWGPMCEFTGSRTVSDATPGRCTKTKGYISYAEIVEYINKGDGRMFHDGSSNTDVMLFNGDYISYMTPVTKDTRRKDWKGLNFAGTIDWALDLQAFTSADFDNLPDLSKGGIGCILGGDMTINSGSLCSFTCTYGFCPDTLCECYQEGELIKPPKEKGLTVRAFDSTSPDMNRLCNFACNHNYCPPEYCDTDPDTGDDGEEENPGGCTVTLSDGSCYTTSPRGGLGNNCFYYKDTRIDSAAPCLHNCERQLAEAKAKGESGNYGCVAFTPAGEEEKTGVDSRGLEYIAGTCQCNNGVVSYLIDTVLHAMAEIAQIGCFLIMSALKSVLDIGAEIFPEIGKPLEIGLDAAASAAQMYNYVYGDSEDPAGAFQWWLSPCGGSDLVPDDIKKVFGIINDITGNVGSWKPPKNIGKGSGKRGDETNPRNRSPLPPSSKPGPKNPLKPKPGGGVKKKCRVPPSKKMRKLSHHTVRELSCDAQHQTKTTDWVVTSVTYPANAPTVVVSATCSAKWAQACYHYSSVIRNNPKWTKLICPPEAGTSGKEREGGPATAVWSTEHRGASWLDVSTELVKTTKQTTKTRTVTKRSGLCDMDEYPPAYLFGENDPDFDDGGSRGDAQLVRFLPNGANRGAGSMWKGVCLTAPFDRMSASDLKDAMQRSGNTRISHSKDLTIINAGLRVQDRPVFSIAKWNHDRNAPNDGLALNTDCWPSAKAPRDPGFALLKVDPYVQNHPPIYRYDQEWNPAVGNGV